MDRPIIRTYSRRQPLMVSKPNTKLVACYPDTMTAGHVRESRLNDVTLHVDDFNDTFDKIMLDAVLPLPPEDLPNEHEDSNGKYQNDSDIFKMPFEVGKKDTKKRDTITREELRLNEIGKKVKAIIVPSKEAKFKKKAFKTKENNENVDFVNKVVKLKKSDEKSKESQQKSKKVLNKTKTSPLKSKTKTQMKECTIAIERCNVSTIVNEEVPTIINKSNQTNLSCKESNNITSFIEEFQNPRKISSINYLDVANSLPTSTPREHKFKVMIDMQHISPIKLHEKYEENIEGIDMKDQSNQNLFIEEPDLKSSTRLSPKIIDTFVNLKSRTLHTRVHRDSENNSHINNRRQTLDNTENKVSSIEDNNEVIESFHNSLVTNEINSSNINEDSNSQKQFSISKRNTDYSSLHLTAVTTEHKISFVESPLLFDDTKDNQSQEHNNTLSLLRKNNENSGKDILIFEKSGNNSKGRTDNKNKHFNSTQNESSYYPDEWTNDYNSSCGYTTNDDTEHSKEKPDNTTIKSSNLCDEKSSFNQNNSHSYNEKNYFNDNETDLKNTVLVETSMSQESEPNSTSKIIKPNTTPDENTEVDESSEEDEFISTQPYTRKRKYSEQSNESQNKELVLHLSTSNDENTDNESPTMSKKVKKRQQIDKTIKKLNFTLTSIDELQDDQISDEGSEPNVTCESIVNVETKLNNTSQNDNFIDKLTKHTKFETTNTSENITSSISRNTQNNQIDQIEREEKIMDEISDNNDPNIIIKNNIIHNNDQIHNSINVTAVKNTKQIDNNKINEIQHNEITVETINKDSIINKNAFDNHKKPIESDNDNQMNDFINDNEKGTNKLNNEELLLPVLNVDHVENQLSKAGKKSIKKNLKNKTKKIVKAKVKKNKIVKNIKNIVNKITKAGNISTEFDTNQITSDNLEKLDSVIINQIPHQQIKLKEFSVVITRLNLPIKKNKSLISLQETITPKTKKDISKNSKPFIECNDANNENNDDYRNHQNQNNVNNNKEKIDAPLERNRITENIEENSKKMDISNKSFISRELCVLLSKLNDPVKITLKRDTYKKWDKPLAVISENLVESPDITSHGENNENCLNEETDHQANKIINDTSLEKREISESVDNHTSLPIFLKPGKSWARSLSIINHFHNGQNLEEMAVGRGKNWRHSVQDVLDMQPEGVTQNSTKQNNEEQERDTHYFRLSEIPQRKSNRISRITISPSRTSRPFSMRIIPSGSRSTLTDTFINSERGSPTTNVTRKTSIPRKTSLRMQRDTLIETEDDLISLAKDIILKRCKQRSYLPFDVCFPDSYIENCRKIGEGVYGEVFLYDDGLKKSVIKIIPIEGKELVNSEPQKKFHEILSEIIIAEELHKLKFGDEFRTIGFVGLNRIKCVVGKYPDKLTDLWKAYDRLKFSENDCPSMFGDEQLYIILDLAHGGQDLEAYEFQNASESYSIFLQTAYTLAVAEQSLQFEHRDLHWGNVLISKTDDKVSSHKLGSDDITLPTNGVKVSIIDFTLSRMSYKGCKIFNDLAADPTLFEAKGEYQFDIYRMMRDSVNNDWQQYNPYTNVLWLDYTLDKMITAARYKKKTTKIHKTAIEKMKQLRKEILDYKSTFDFVTNCEKIKIVTK